MHAILKEILRNLKRHRGTAQWVEPEREPTVGEVRGFRWEFPSGRRLTLMLEESGQIQVTKETTGFEPLEAESLSLASNELEKLRELYRWVASGE